MATGVDAVATNTAPAPVAEANTAFGASLDKASQVRSDVENEFTAASASPSEYRAEDVGGRLARRYKADPEADAAVISTLNTYQNSASPADQKLAADIRQSYESQEVISSRPDSTIDRNGRFEGVNRIDLRPSTGIDAITINDDDSLSPMGSAIINRISA